MVILTFRGNKGEDPKIFLREYKRACISTRFKTIIEWLNFFLQILEGTTSHWFEQQTKTLKGS
jgi:hypothetical protein